MSIEIPDSMDPSIVAQIRVRLDEVRREHGVAIPLAIESGSRAWGFPSPDSDYDCRFIFVRPADHYLSPWPKRDVIETPLDEVFDVNGWDLAKALRLLLNGNAVVIEWLMSPIFYTRDDLFAEGLLDLARNVVDRGRVMFHYLHLGERQRRTYFGDQKNVKSKKIFYALRPAAVLRWMRLHPHEAIAPMNFLALMEGCDPPRDVLDLTRILLAEKAKASEMGSAPLEPVLAAFIDSEFELARRFAAAARGATTRDSQERAEAFFLSVLRGR